MMAQKASKQKSHHYTDEQIEKILNYTNEIQSLESFVDYVRETPDVYIGKLGNVGFLTLLREVFQNGTDEIQKEDSPCDLVILTYDERTKYVVVEDNGRGFPHSRIADIISKDHTSSNYVKKPFNYTAGKNGMGIGIVNALTSKFIIESSILGETHRVEFNEGIVWDKGEVLVKSNKFQGSIISFYPCIDVLGDITVTWQEVLYLVSLIVPTLKIGAKVIFNAIDLNGITHNETLTNKDGILYHLINICQTPMVSPIRFIYDNGNMKCEVIFTYDIEDTSNYNIMSFNNFCPTSSGSHENGFVDGLCNYFRNYMNKIYLANTKNKKLQIVNKDILCGLRAVVNTCLLKPKYDGQNKDILNNPEISPFCAHIVLTGLTEWEKKNPKDLQKICKWIKDIAEVRIKNDTAKIKISNNYKKSIIGGSLPATYAPPTGKNDGHWEFIIVEGKSPAGSAKDARDAAHQGIFGIRGKFPNAMNNTREKILNNSEAAGIISILDEGRGINYGSKYDISLCPYEKIIIMTDADVDGKGHIRPLLLKFFLVYMTPLVEAGRLYAAEPPLYYAELGKKMIYFSDDIELSQYINKRFSKNNTIETLDGKKLSSTELSQLINRNANYMQMIDHVSSSFAVDAHLLEVIINNYTEGYAKLKSIIENRWRFAKVAKLNKVIIVSGPIGNKVQAVPIDDRFIGACMPLIQLSKRSEIGYKINGQPFSLYDTINVFEKLKPSNIKRFKGLGEMNANQLAESTVLPTSNRSLIRYTCEDIKKEIAEIRKIESDFSVLLRDVRGIRKEDLV